MAGKRRLAKGMTVQSRNGARVAYCVICSWESKGMSFNDARELATYDCPRAKQHPKRGTQQDKEET